MGRTGSQLNSVDIHWGDNAVVLEPQVFSKDLAVSVACLISIDIDGSALISPESFILDNLFHSWTDRHACARDD